MAATARAPRAEGDISSVFASLSGSAPQPLPDRFADIKTSLIQGREKEITASWQRLLSTLRSEIDQITTHGSSIIPEIEFSEINNFSRVQPFTRSLKKRGVAVIRDVVPESEALSWKQEIRDYIRANPQTKAFPKDNKAVYELYWSPGQIKARAHPNVLETQKFLMSFWHTDSDPAAKISTSHPVSYADRLRIRMPGDAGFALGPHIDGGSAERWEKNGYGLGAVYDKIFEGRWEEFDSWDASGRVNAESDLYNGAGACSMFRMFQGWLSMSNTGAGEGTLLVNPLFNLATAYYLLRPFFSPKMGDVGKSGFLETENWELDPVQSTALQGATLGCAQELTTALHPHLELEKSMVSVPNVKPGDYVAWHCDMIHAVDGIHGGKGDSSVLYIPVCPLTEANARYLVTQREAFKSGTPGPDFPGGVGESQHVGQMKENDIKNAGGEEGLKSMGLKSWEPMLHLQVEKV
ncbi:DUF1479-domain-containing protein [Mollisia scopiformis]|uniref:DUF1479-domain-containing protein n=1 Tax=Mollisia scopiformis TaxID=149040 RepID=A0A194XVE7_MOLSC|nr:DUF1479-domain-containing protein [Mollisia scopiformis]KUJ24198.1 DUF1479-domain-containing protein [Mollisia scopiformis]